MIISQEWLAHLLAKKAMETSSARCDSPKRVAHRRISTLHHSKFRCKGNLNSQRVSNKTVFRKFGKGESPS